MNDSEEVDAVVASFVEVGRQLERARIMSIIELDLLTSQEVKERLRALAYGGYENIES